MNVSALAKKIESAPELKAGTLRFWGEWFGRPHDNYHQIVNCSADGSSLILEFNAGETLRIDEPEGVRFGPSVFSVANAAGLKWEWFYYGRPREPENLYFIEYVRDGSKIRAATNVDWYEPVLAPSESENAVEIL